MKSKHDFREINRAMRAFARRRMKQGRPLFEGGAPEGDGQIAVLDASDLVQVDPALKASIVKDDAALGQFVARVQTYAQQASRSIGEQREKILAMAADLKTAKESTEEALKAAKRAEEIAKDQARLVPGAKDLSLEALRTIPMPHEPDHEFAGRLSRGQYNVLMLSRAELERLDEPVVRAVERYRALQDQIAMVHAYMLGGDRTRAQAYIDRGGMKSQRAWKQYEPLARQLQGAMDTAEAGAGLEWVPTGVGISVIEDIRPEFELASYIPTVPMPRSPYVYPVQGSHFRSYKLTEGTTDTPSTDTPAKIGKRNLSTLNLTFTAVKQGAMVLVSSELVEDAIVPLIAAIRADLAFAIIAGKEDGILNGQLTAAIDTAAPPAATDPGSFWDGLRYFATLTGASYDFSAGIVVEGLTNLRGQLGKYGKSARFGVWATGYIGWAKLLTLKDSPARWCSRPIAWARSQRSRAVRWVCCSARRWRSATTIRRRWVRGA